MSPTWRTAEMEKPRRRERERTGTPLPKQMAGGSSAIWASAGFDHVQRGVGPLHPVAGRLDQRGHRRRRAGRRRSLERDPRHRAPRDLDHVRNRNAFAVALGERTYAEHAGVARRPRRGIRTRAQVEQQPGVRERGREVRAPVSGQRREAGEAVADRQLVRGGPVVRAHDAPQRAEDQHAVARAAAELVQAQVLEQHAGVDRARPRRPRVTQRGIERVEQRRTRFLQLRIGERTEVDGAPAARGGLALGGREEHEHGRQATTGGRRASSSPMPYAAAENRYEQLPYRRCGRSGLKLPVVSLGLWHNFGADRPLETQRAILRRAFDLGVTHFDLANNYGPPYGSAEENFKRHFAEDFRPFRDELLISTKAGYDMWPGPYGEWGSRKYVLASLDQSLRRMGLEYVDIFYSHRFDPDTPLEETMGALDTAVRQGKALYAGISSYSSDETAAAARILRELGTPLLIHQPSYSMLNRWIEPDLLGTLEQEGVGCIVFSPLAQGMLSDKYLNGIPEGSRASRGGSLSPRLLSDEALEKIRALNEIAQQRGQSLAQMALAWTLRDPRITSTLVGVSSLDQLEANVAALDNLELADDELGEIDRHATDSGINLWA